MFGVFSTNAQQFEPEMVGDVCVLEISNDTVLIPTEKAIPQIKTAASAGKILVGIGNVRSKAVIKGAKSPTQIQAEGPVSIVVKCQDNSSDPTAFIQLVKLEEKKKDRRAELANVNWLGSVTEGNMEYVGFRSKRYGESSYILTFPAMEGEYGVRILNPNDVDEKMPVFNCFGIHNYEY